MKHGCDTYRIAMHNVKFPYPLGTKYSFSLLLILLGDQALCPHLYLNYHLYTGAGHKLSLGGLQ